MDYGVYKGVNCIEKQNVEMTLHRRVLIFISACFVCSARTFDLFMRLLCRCAGRGLQGAEALVLYCLLRAQQSCGGGVSGFLHQPACRWLHRSLQQLQPILPRPAFQRQPQLHDREHPAAHRQR